MASTCSHCAIWRQPCLLTAGNIDSLMGKYIVWKFPVQRKRREPIPALCLQRHGWGGKETKGPPGAEGDQWVRGQFNIFAWGKEKTFPICIPCCIETPQEPTFYFFTKTSISHRPDRAQPLPEGSRAIQSRTCFLLYLTTSFCQLQEATCYCSQMWLRDLRVTWSWAQR